jgi:hypothetical protein
LAEELRAARDWREQQFAGIAQVKDGWEDYADKIETIFNDRVRKAYDDDLNRRKDWAAGVARVTRDVAKAQEDLAAQSERALRQWNMTWERALTDLHMTAQERLGALIEMILSEIAKLAYQQSGMASAVSGLGSAIFSAIGSILGVPMGVPAGHGGAATLAGATMTRAVSPLAFVGAPRLHSGYAGRGRGGREMPFIGLENESIFTPEQLDGADAIVAAIQNRPLVLKLPEGMAAGGVPKVEVNVHNAPAGTRARGEASQQQDGTLTIDVMLEEIEGRMADRIGRGKSPVGTAMQNTYGLQRHVR